MHYLFTNGVGASNVDCKRLNIQLMYCDYSTVVDFFDLFLKNSNRPNIFEYRLPNYQRFSGKYS